MADRFARAMRKELTEAEVRIWARLRLLRSRGLRFRRQSPIGRYILDFEHRKAKVAIELDGRQHEYQADYDEARSAWLEMRGYVVLRYDNGAVLQYTDEVVHEILITVESILRDQR